MGQYDEFATAIRVGEASLATDLLRQHPEWEDRLDQPLPGEGFGQTPLLIAATRGDRDLVDALLSAGATPDARSRWWAGGFGVLDIESPLTDYLIERGATVDVHAAARLGRIERLRQLLDQDPALVHARGGDGQTPLHFAANREVAGLLLERGAAIDAIDVDHESTPAQYMLQGREDVARYLVSRGCRTDILMAAALGDLEGVMRHVKEEPESLRLSVEERYFPKRNPHAGGSIYIWKLGWFQTAHSLASARGHGAVADFVMEHSQPTWKLVLACERGDAATVERLLASGVRPAESDYYRLPAAAQLNRTEAVALLLGAGWPVGAQGNHKITALHWAAWHGNAAAVRVLLEHGASLTAVESEYGGTPLAWAKHGEGNSWHRATGDYAAVIGLLTR